MAQRPGRLLRQQMAHDYMERASGDAMRLWRLADHAARVQAHAEILLAVPDLSTLTAAEHVDLAARVEARAAVLRADADARLEAALAPLRARPRS